MKNLKILISLFTAILLLSACQKDLSYEDNTLGPDQWQFRFFPTFYTGTLSKTYISNKTLYIKGTSFDSSHNFQITLYSDNGSFVIGDYKASLQQSTFMYSKGGQPIFQSNAPLQELDIRITLITNDVVIGNFFGYVKDTANNNLKLTQGKFNANFTP